MKRLLQGVAATMVAAIVTVVLLVGCVSTGVDNYRQFRGAVKAGATCTQLYDIKSNFERSSDRAGIQQDLDEIGCESPSSTRTDL